MHAHPLHSKTPVVQNLREQVTAQPNVLYANKTPACGLIFDADGEPCSVTAHAKKTGEVQKIRCRQVVLAAGGFATSREIMAQFIPEINGAPYVNSQTNTKDTIQ